ncbi:M23 family metallopeptidase [Fibrobacter sp. UBA4309]|uniref:M23 family metallopeptidase n=1 Tax=Fibrobacter sp. UBA4309 TaxID=1946537 RepID=UPI0025C4FD28|nr:M23 family metallopeptidase [Fibrobacter sp. UBA4309]
MKKITSKLTRVAGKVLLPCLLGLAIPASAEECNEKTMDAFAYEDCLAEQRAAKGNSEQAPDAGKQIYSPFQRDAYLTSSFGENRGTRYHAGLDYSTNMEEGWVVYAPEDGNVTEIRTSPFGYGKVMFFKGASGKTWVFAHQSSFGRLDEQVIKKQYASKKNDVTLKPNTAYKKGDTLTFAGSSGIGNPHLHLEVRLDNDRIVNPCKEGVMCLDTIAPQVFGVAVWQGNEFATTNATAFNKGCAVTPVKNEFGLYMAVKIADYSREPKDNPMSIRRIELWRYDEKIYSKIQDTLSFKKMLNIRDELLWAEEADTAGDWHYINAKLAPLSTYRLEIEDFAGNVTTKKFTLHPKCKGNEPLQQTKVQTSPVYTFLSRPMLDLFRCRSGYKFKALGAKDEEISEDLCSVFKHRATLLAKIVETYPELRAIQYSASAEATGSGKAVDETIAVFPYGKYQKSINWNSKIGDVGFSQKISGIPVAIDTAIRVLAVTRTRTDSLDYLEFHPKGLQFFGNWNVCIENPANPAPLYWLGETSRDWFIFSKQTGGKKRCASVNELRDIANINNEEGPTLGFPYWSDAFINGLSQPVLKIPVMFRYDGVADGNAITVKAGKKWIAAEYDSEPREIILYGEDLPESGENITIQIVDEAKHKVSYDVTIPGM